MSDALLSVNALGVLVASATGARPLLADVHFDLRAGESLGIVGESGAGKSTLAMSLLGLLPRGGRFADGTGIALDGRAIEHRDAAAWRRLRGRQIGTVFQEPLLALDPSFTVGDQLREAVEAHRLDRGRAADDRAEAALARVGFADAGDAMRRYPHELSGGMRQRALIAAAVVLEPRLLIADEPTTALDVTLQAQVLDLLDELRSSMGMALLLISHDLDVVAERCSRALVLDQGRVVEAADVHTLLSTPKSDAARRLAGARRRSETIARAAVAVTQPPLLEAQDVQVRFPAAASWSSRERRATQAVRGVSLTLQRGEALGVVGESGCGKSSLARALLRLGPLSAATLRFDGSDLLALGAEPLRALRRRMQFVSQDAGASLTPHCRVRELIGEGIVVHGLAQGGEVARRVDAALERFGLDARIADALPGDLSSGQRQRVALARALAVEPDLIVCDEPVASLDAALRADVLAHLDALRRERGLGIILISHDLDAVRRIADRIAVMYHGRFVETGSAVDVASAPMMPYTQALLAAEPGTASASRRRVIGGQVPSAVSRIAGCPFFPRCEDPRKDAACQRELPPLREIGPGRAAACAKIDVRL